MALNAESLEKIIRQVAEEVLKQIAEEDASGKGVLAVFPGYVFDAAGIKKHLNARKKEVTCALLNEAEFTGEGCAAFRVETAGDKKKLAAGLQSYEEVVLVTPPLWLLKALAQGDDTVYEAMLILRPLLWEKDVTVLLDFEAPRFKRSTAYADIAETISALESMGLRIESLGRKKAVKEEEKDLVTAEDVREAAKNGTMRVKAKKGAIVTQLAQDAAKETGVTIER